MYQVKAYFVLTDREILTDEIRIQDAPWSVMREFAMKKRYKGSKWYKKCTDEEKRLVDLLRKAQTAQGDMLELKSGSDEEMKATEYNDMDYFEKTFSALPIVMTPQKQKIVAPQSQIRVPIEKIVGLFGVKYSLCNIFINKNFFEYGEIANISVHIDNSRVGEDCSLAVAQLTKIYYKLPREATRGKKDVYEHQWLVQKEVKGPLCAAGEKKSMLIKFGIGKSKPNDFELRMDSELDENEYEYKEQ